MTDMGIKKKYIKSDDLSMGIAVLSIATLFIIGMVKWPDFPKDGTWLGNLYYVTVANVIYALSVVTLILAKKIFTRIAACIMLAISSVNVYTELYLDPLHWGRMNFWMIIILSANLLLTVFIIEKVKSKNERKRTHNN